MASSDNNNIHKNVIELANDIKYGNVNGTYNIVTATISVLKELVSKEEWNTARKLMDIIILNGKYLNDAAPLEESIGNMVRRILYIIREEYSELKNKTISELISEPKCKTDEAVSQEAPSLHNIVTCDDNENADFNMIIPSLKSALIQDICEYESELENCRENIVNQAPNYLHSNEIILTIGRSRLVEEFLIEAAKTRFIEVIVAEAHPSLSGHDLVANLGDAKIKVTLISDAAIFAMMSRVTKVIIGTHTVMANGGLRAICCSRIVAEAARYYCVPVYVLFPLYKLSPCYLPSNELPAFSQHKSPLSSIISEDNAALLERCEIPNPAFEYVPPDRIKLFITNNGGNSPSYIYRLISELYHPDDYEL